MSDLSQQFAARIRAAAGPLVLRGRGSKDFYGNAPQGEALDVSGHRGIVAYEPTELVITARAGTPLAEIEAALAEKGQMLAFEPPHFGEGATSSATLGGCVAAGLSGPRRATAGAVRDYVLGVKLLDGQARELNFGGQVMKNVAGYDVSRLIAGSLGTLGLILEVSLKVLPRPVAEATLRFDLPEAKALETMNQWAGKPLPVSATAWCDDVLTLRLSGARAAVAAAVEKLGGALVAASEASQFWAGLREQQLDYFAGDEALWRLSLPSTAAPADLPGATFIEWGGSQRWLRGDIDAGHVREVAAKLGGHATLFRGGDKSVGVFHPLAPALAALNARVRSALDPRKVFDTGRL
ncbi:MAG: glycolate oxidase subunit GlcE [Sterolibacteriaceae bacterium MAG5]|nr:glycolate oxidase subunit GlcE [Candidatus Nitricoxidireducens bremensis]